MSLLKRPLSDKDIPDQEYIIEVVYGDRPERWDCKRGSFEITDIGTCKWMTNDNPPMEIEVAQEVIVGFFRKFE
jgi:hypothetical protein